MVRLGIEQELYVYKYGDLLLGKGDPYAEIKIDEQAVIYTTAYAKEHNIWPRPSIVPQQTENLNPSKGSITDGGHQPEEPKSGEKKQGYNFVPSTHSKPTPTSSPSHPYEFKAEKPLREALTKIWEDARGAQVKKISLLKLRVFDSSDGFKLLGAINTVSGADKQVKLTAEYETANSSSFSIEFEGLLGDAQPIKDFLQPQLRAASETRLDITFTLTYANGLDLNGDQPQKITEKLTRFATGAAYVEAYAEGGV
jgi:hypothetical protein